MSNSLQPDSYNNPNDELYSKVAHIIDSGREEAAKAVYNAMTRSYFLVGKEIVEDELLGMERAEYGKEQLQTLSEKLSLKYGRGYSVRSLQEIKRFYLEIQKTQTLSAELNFSLPYSHYLLLLDRTEWYHQQNNFEIVEKHLNKVSNSEIQGYICEINILEILYQIGKEDGLAIAEDFVNDLELTVSLEVVGIDRATIRQAAKYKLPGNIALPDCILLATAKKQSAKIITTDPEFKQYESEVDFIWI